MAVDPADPDTLVASASLGPIQAHTHPFAESYMIRRTKGQPWERVSTGLPLSKGSIIYDIVTNPHEPGVFYAANNRGVFRSDDTGIKWTRLEVAWPKRYETQHQTDLAITQV